MTQRDETRGRARARRHDRGHMALAAALRARLDALAVSSDDDDHARAGSRSRAAVLVPVVERRADARHEVILCVRDAGMRAHAGEVALPGGKRDDGDVDDVATALREAEEEIGLGEGDVEVCGRLPVILSRFNVSVRPVVGVVRETFEVDPAKISRDEVAEVFTAPLEMFLEAKNHRYDDWAWPKAERAIRVHYFDYRGLTIWGLTAMILIEVARRVYQREPEFAVATEDGVSVWDVKVRDGKPVVIKSSL